MTTKLPSQSTCSLHRLPTTRRDALLWHTLGPTRIRPPTRPSVRATTHARPCMHDHACATVHARATGATAARQEPKRVPCTRPPPPALLCSSAQLSRARALAESGVRDRPRAFSSCAAFSCAPFADTLSSGLPSRADWNLDTESPAECSQAYHCICAISPPMPPSPPALSPRPAPPPAPPAPPPLSPGWLKKGGHVLQTSGTCATHVATQEDCLAGG